MRRTATALVLAAGLASTACGSTTAGAGSPAPETTSASTSASPSPSACTSGTATNAAGPAEFSGYLLEAGELPTGFELEDVPPVALQAYTAGFCAGGLPLRGVEPEVDPATCGDSSPFADLDRVALLSTVDPEARTYYYQSAGPAGPGLDELRATLERCGNVSVAYTSPDGVRFESSVETTLLPDPDVGADSALALTTRATVTIDSSTSTTEQVSMHATVGPVVVSVDSQVLAEPVDEDALVELLSRAVATVRAG